MLITVQYYDKDKLISNLIDCIQKDSKSFQDLKSEMTNVINILEWAGKLVGEHYTIEVGIESDTFYPHVTAKARLLTMLLEEYGVDTSGCFYDFPEVTYVFPIYEQHQKKRN